MKRGSIRRRLLAGVAVVQIAAAVLATALVVRHERTRSYALLEAGLVEHAAVVESVIQPPDEDTGDPMLLHRELLTLPKHDVYVLSDATGRVIAASGEWRPTPPLPAGARSFADMKVEGKWYRVLVLRDVALLNAEPDEVAKLPKLMLVYGSRVAGVEEHVWRVAWISTAVGLAILLASLVATGWVVRTGLRPVVRLAGRAAGIDAAHWELEPASEGEEAEELMPLATALARLVDRLRAAFERERQFSADAAHEMKTAVAIVKSTLQLTLERERTTAEYRAGMERALEDTERMQALVSGMLQLAKIEGLGGALRQDAVADVVVEVRRTERQLSPLLEARGILLRVETAEVVQPVRMTAEGLGVVLTNLLENAIHYSADGSAIEVKLYTRGDECVVSVADEGCGIEERALPHIFERFYRGDASRSRESGGNGLGLAIVQAVVEKAGGSVMAASTVGVGSVFTVRLRRG